MSIRDMTRMAAAIAMMSEAQGAYFQPVGRIEPEPKAAPDPKKRAKVKAARKQRQKAKAGRK